MKGDLPDRPSPDRCSRLSSEPDKPLLRRCSGCLTELGTSSKRPLSGSNNCSGRAAKRPAVQQRQKHLYLVVDDWERGYSIRKVDADASLDEPPPVVRIEAQHGLSWSFASHGSKIFAMCPPESSPGIPVLDTETLGVTVCASPLGRSSVKRHKPVYASVAGDRLVALLYPHLEVLGPAPPPPPPPRPLGEAEKPWAWTEIQPQPPTPFASCLVSGYALHPDGRTVFMSVKGWRDYAKSTPIRGDRNSTFALDTESFEWSYLGEWLLPFKGRAEYDSELGAWVGLCLYNEGAGHICCCDLGRDKLFDMDVDSDTDTYVGATLVYMGDSRFCLVECRRPEGYELNRSLRDARELNMATFVVKYDKEGDLRTSKHRPYGSMSYKIAHENTLDPSPNPVAFWM
nr:unnamed protein product [Digitaria exilis]